MGHSDLITRVSEPARTAALHRLHQHDWSEAELAEPVALAQAAAGTACAQLGFVGESHVLYAVSLGLAVRELPRRIAFCADVVGRDLPLVVRDAHADARYRDNPLVTHEPGVRFYAGHPVHAPGGEAVASLCVMDFAPREWGARDAAILEGAARFASLLVRLRSREDTHRAVLEELARSREEALRDPLTSTWNRNGALQLLERSRARAARRKEPLTVLRLAIDEADGFAQRYGRHALESVICAGAVRLRSTLRPYDVLGRLDDHEFVVALHDAGVEHSRLAAHRLVNALTEPPYEVSGVLREISATAGAAFCDFRSHAYTAAALTAHAGHAMRDARVAGERLGWRAL